MRRRTYRFLSVALAGFAADYFLAATIGFDALAGYVECATAALVRRTRCENARGGARRWLEH